jgi:hypothetical protein
MPNVQRPVICKRRERCRQGSVYREWSTSQQNSASRQCCGIENHTDNGVWSTRRQSSGIECRTDNELQTEKVVERTTLSTECQQITRGLAQRRL